MVVGVLFEAVEAEVLEPLAVIVRGEDVQGDAGC